MWLRAAACVPLALWFPFARFLAFLAWRVIPYRREVVQGNLMESFPEWDDAQRERVIRDYYRGFADMLVEILQVARMSRADVDRRVPISNPCECVVIRIQAAFDGRRCPAFD